MRLPTTLAGLLYLIVTQAPYAVSSPLFSKDELQNDLDWIRHLFDRQAACAGTYCGVSSQYCCTAGSTCYTDAQTIARCGAPTAAAVVGGWQYFTTTIVMTDLVTITSTYSSLVVAATTTQNLAQSIAVCSPNQGSCGAICCDNSSEYCYALGKCTTYGVAGTTAAPSAPLRPTSGTAATVTAFVSATTTQSFQTPVGTGESSGNGTAIIAASSSGGLSGGAIAGIVIGVLAGIIILIAVCFCCVLKAGIDGILGLFGLRNNRSRERTEVIEERYSRHGSASSRRDTHGGFGGGGRTTRTEKKRSGMSEGGILLSILAALGTLWAVLGIRRKSKEKTARSEVSFETHSGSFSGTGTSESSLSSDRRTRDTRRTRETRESRRVTSRPR